MAAYQFKATNNNQYIVASNTAGKWVVIPTKPEADGSRGALDGQHKTRAAAIRSFNQKVSQ